MNNNKILHCIAEKVEDIQVALFYCLSNNPLKINNNIIHTLKIDDSGCIYFFIHRPRQLISQFEQEFPVGLNYFKKGKNYFMNIFGKARMINDPEELAYQTDLSTEEISCALTTHVLVKVKILKVDFYDNNYERKNLLLKKIWLLCCSLFDKFGIASGTYDLSHTSHLHHYGF